MGEKMKNLFERTSSNWVRYSENPIKLYRHYPKAFVASRPSAVFCNPQCKNKHNDNRNVVGLTDTQANAEAISRLIKERISPYPNFILVPEREDGKNILI